MAIFIPGLRNRHNRKSSSKRSVVATLQLVAMVDLFTVMVVFLLQNYATTGEVLDIPEGVKLPEAHEVKDLKPANVVIISEKDIRLNNDILAQYAEVKAQQDWTIKPLLAKVKELVDKGEKDKAAIGSQLQKAVQNIKKDASAENEIDKFRKVTVQADQKIDFLTLKKVLYTITQGGVYEINFAVLKQIDKLNQ